MEVIWICNVPPHRNANQHPRYDRMRIQNLRVNYGKEKVKGTLKIAIHDHKTSLTNRPRFGVSLDGEMFKLKNDIQIEADASSVCIVLMVQGCVKDKTETMSLKQLGTHGRRIIVD
jgi:hypothetical protein